MEMHTSQSSDQSQKTGKEIGEQESIPTPPERSQLAQVETSEEICQQKPDATLQEPSHQVEKGLHGAISVSDSSHSTCEGASSMMQEPLTLVNSVGWGISILGWVISPIMSKLVSKGCSYLHDVPGSSAINLRNLDDRIQSLKRTLEKARLSSEGDKKLVEEWAKKLKSAFYDAEDILDAIDYHLLESKAMLRRQSEKASLKKDFNVPNESEKELRETLKRIEDLIHEGLQQLLLLLQTNSGDNIKSSPKHTTGSLSKSSQTTSELPKVFGRDGDTAKIISMLHDDTAADHSVVGIYGIPGSGKTTLVQYVLESEMKSGVPYFQLFIWIHVTENFSVHTLYSEMLEQASGQKMKWLNLDMLQSELEKRLKGNRVLLVLDDVWYSESVNKDPQRRVDKQNDLKKLLSPLKKADKGSRVLVTSRTADAVKLLGAQSLVPISDMDEEEFFKMFMHYALDKSLVREQDKGKFETIGKEISLLLRKSPLAGRTVAGQLGLRTSRAENISFWIDTLNRKCDLLNDTMGALWWSYHQLEEHARQCFAYCSMFPRRYELKREELVKMWMAQGFGDTSKTSDIEFAARECFEVLLSTSFIQLKCKTDDLEYYTVHDLLHDLAERVVGSDCFRIEKDMVDNQIPKDVRHLFIDSNNPGEFIEQIVKLDTLRTLVMSHYSIDGAWTAENFERILKNLKKLRFVSVHLIVKYGDNVIPECIGELKHLRYLGLHGFPLIGWKVYLPRAFTKLYHLQELSFHDASQMHYLDSDHMADLENLRRIAGGSSIIPNIGRMSWLQTLGDYYTVKKEMGYEITQLENLNNIHGKLHIRGLGNIQSKEEARRANLSNKVHVSHLILDWEPKEDEETGSSSRKKQKTIAGHHQQVVTPPKPEEILEALHPPALLVQLLILNYGGSTFPSWLSGEDYKLKHLESLTFHSCHGSGSRFRFSEPLPAELHTLDISWCSWNALPDNINQLTSLEILSVCSCINIESLPGLPSSLKIVKITECENIQTLPGLPSSLKKLQITVCENIQTLPELPPSLEDFLIDYCPDIKSLPGLPSSLKKLQITVCKNIQTLPELPPSLEDFLIDDCPDIKSLPGLPSSLKKFQILVCLNIKTLPELPPSLEDLLIYGCPNIESLPGLPSSLKKLQIHFCRNIKTLPELPPSLEELQCKRYLADSYQDRQAIDRIKVHSMENPDYFFRERVRTRISLRRMENLDYEADDSME